MVLQNFYKLSLWIFGKKYDYYGSMTEYLEFNENLKHEIIWQKPERRLDANAVMEQPSLF